MATLVNDTFTDTNGTALEDHTPDTDSVGWGWGNLTGTWDIQGNKAQPDGVTSAWNHVVIQSGDANATVEVDLTVAGGATSAVRMLVRAIDSTNFWAIENQTGTDTLQIYEVLAGVPTSRDSGAATMDAGNTYTLKVVLNGTTITAYWDNVETASYGSASKFSGIPIHGIGSYVGGGFTVVTFDSFSITGVAIPTAYSEWTSDDNAHGEHAIIKNGLLYGATLSTASNNGVNTYDPRSGTRIQRFISDANDIACAPVIDSSGTMHVFSNESGGGSGGVLYKVDRYKGEIDSLTSLDEVDFEALAYDSANGVIVVADGGTLKGIDISDYSTAWTASGPSVTTSQYGAVLLNGSYFYFLDNNAVLYKLNLADGSTDDSVDVSASTIAGSYNCPIYDSANNYIYVGDFTGRTVYAVDLTSFTVDWSETIGAAGDEIKRTMAYNDNVLFVTVRETAANYNSKIYALDVTDSGNVLWTNTTAAAADAQVSSLMVDDWYVYATTYDFADDDYNQLLVLDRTTGVVATTFDQGVGASSAIPVARGGHLYIGLWDNSGMKALDIRGGGGETDFPWKANENTYDGYIGAYMTGGINFQSSTLASLPGGTKVSTDEDVVNGQIQRVKLAVSADGSSTHIGGDANGLQVQGGAAEDAAVAGSPVLSGGRYDATARSIDDGDVGGLAGDSSLSTSLSTFSSVLDFTPTLDTSIYADGDVLSEAEVLNSVVRLASPYGTITSMHVIDKDYQGQPFDVVISDSTINIGTQNAAVNISDADAAKILGIVSIGSSDYIDLVNSQTALKDNLGIEVSPASGTSLYVSAISRGTGTYTASGIVIRFGINRR